MLDNNMQQDFSALYTEIKNIKKIKQHVTSAPTYTPKTFFDQIVFYDDGSTRRIYFYINSAWYYATLT